MDNIVCNFEILQSPNRRYADTVNLVFFRAVPVTKNFQKYINGIQMWKRHIKHYPTSQLQVFVDTDIANNETVRKILHELNARVILFTCPNYLRDDGYHMGLFATMVRFYPMFDVNPHPLKIAHIQEVEPDPTDSPKFDLMVSAGNKDLKKYNVAMICSGANMLNIEKEHPNLAIEKMVPYPWIFAGRFSALQKIPFSVWTNYLGEIESGKKMFNIYGYRENTEHGKYSVGTDETFLNMVYLPWLIANDYAVGFINEYRVSYAVYWLQEHIRKDSRSKQFLNYVLQSNQSVLESLREFDNMFYRDTFTKPAEECAVRFYETVEKYPDWLGKSSSYMILKFYKGYLKRRHLIVVRNNTFIASVDL